jgi:hypothetical protein
MHSFQKKRKKREKTNLFVYFTNSSKLERKTPKSMKLLLIKMPKPPIQP